MEDDARPTPAAPGPPTDEPLGVDELRDAWAVLDPGERIDGLRLLPREDGEEFFIALAGPDQAELLVAMRRGERRSWLRLLEPDDVADVVQAVPDDERAGLLALLDGPTRKEVEALLAYEEDDAGGLMNTRYARLRPAMTADEAISYLRRQARTQLETIYYAYVLESDQHLLGVVSFRDLFAAGPSQRVSEIMERDVVSADPGLDQEALSRLFAEHDLTVMPIVDAAGVMRGIVTVDDIVDVVQEEATEDAQKFGGMEALEVPYLQSRRREMLRKRGVWLAVLLVGEMLTTSALGFFQHQIDRATVLTLFIPLIISSGGNAGSQASTLVIRAMALGEVRAADWWRVMRRELAIGLALGAGLGVLGLIRVLAWGAFGSYGVYYARIGVTVSISLIGVVLFGTLAGSMLPFVLRKIGADPASASAPFVATLVDVTGLVIYFALATLMLRGALL
ncbi:MAG: magnesium transporter [Myxococcales bacterium]|nr:magnesium transporter [Myxococcales bacterium]MBK7197810.1 magnesium transporter [Myxococcales bacterium]MBP6846718.1 magnesium transporter [Kofleriaceae bacterium]